MTKIKENKLMIIKIMKSFISNEFLYILDYIHRCIQLTQDGYVNCKPALSTH